MNLSYTIGLSTLILFSVTCFNVFVKVLKNSNVDFFYESLNTSTQNENGCHISIRIL